jgi:ankyrin repeat protein
LSDEARSPWLRLIKFLPAVLVVGFVAWCSQNQQRRTDAAPIAVELAELFQTNGLVDGPVRSDDLAKAAKRAGPAGMNRMLYAAASDASLPALKWIVEHGADPRSVGALEDVPLLFRAAKRPLADRLDYLIGTGLDPTERSRDGLSLMHVAAQNGLDERVLALLRAKGLTTADTASDGRQPIHYANVKSIGVLAKAGADLNAVDREGRTVLHWAAFEGRQEVVAQLLTLNASVFTADAKGRTPLHLAALGRSDPTVDALLAAGAPRTVRDNDGMTPRDLAESAAKRQQRDRGYRGVADKL